MYTTKITVKRPVWKNHKIIGYVIMSREDADFLNKIQKEVYLGFTKEECDIIQNEGKLACTRFDVIPRSQG